MGSIKNILLNSQATWNSLLYEASCFQGLSCLNLCFLLSTTFCGEHRADFVQHGSSMKSQTADQYIYSFSPLGGIACQNGKLSPIALTKQGQTFSRWLMLYELVGCPSLLGHACSFYKNYVCIYSILKWHPSAGVLQGSHVDVVQNFCASLCLGHIGKKRCYVWDII